MAAFVPQMSQQRAIRFGHRLALPLAFDGVRLAYGDGDHTVEMPRQRIAHEIEVQRRLADGRSIERQAEAQQRIDEPLLGAFEFTPRQHVRRLGKIGNGPVERTGDAERRR